MKNLSASLLVAASLVSAPALAMEKHGVTVPDTATIEGKELKLTGMGLREKWFVDVYVAALYLSDSSRSPLEDQTKQVRIVVMRDLSKGQVGSAIRDGFEVNPDNDQAKLKSRLDKLINALADVKKGEALVLTYDPDKSATQVTSGGKDLVTIEGKDFGQALFAVWLGKKPVNEAMKKEMLGQK